MTGFSDSNLKFQLILAISVFMSRINFMLNRVELEISFIALGAWSASACTISFGVAAQ